MRCPYCQHESSKVIDTRESSEKVRRRRECKDCERRFTTYETVEKFDVIVEKRSGEEEEFREEKIRSGIETAVENTEISEEEIEEMVDAIKSKALGQQRITTEEIGEEVKKQLLKRSEVAYIRFASVYESFDSAESFQEEVEAIQDD